MSIFISITRTTPGDFVPSFHQSFYSEEGVGRGDDIYIQMLRCTVYWYRLPLTGQMWHDDNSFVVQAIRGAACEEGREDRPWFWPLLSTPSCHRGSIVYRSNLWHQWGNFVRMHFSRLLQCTSRPLTVNITLINFVHGLSEPWIILPVYWKQFFINYYYWRCSEQRTHHAAVRVCAEGHLLEW